MNILTIPLRNIRRRPTRTMLLLLVFSLGVAAIVALHQVSVVVGESLEKKLTSFGANIIISPNTEKLSLSYGGFHMGDMLLAVQNLPEEETVRAIRSIGLSDRISTVAPKLVTMAKVDQALVPLVGVRWPDELRVKGYWATDGAIPEKDGEVLVGSRAAARLGLDRHDRVNLLGREMVVAGILHETGGDDDGVIFIELGVLQSLTDRPGATSFIEVAALCHGCPIDDIVAQVQQQLPTSEVRALRQVVDQRMASIHFVQHLALSISLVILVIAAAMVGLSMLSAVNERKKDIGILRSLGFAKAQIFLIFCFEAGLIGAAAGLSGYLSGFAASFQILPLLAIVDGPPPSFSLTHLLLAGVVFGTVAVLAAVYPAAKGAAVEPSTALVAL
jgi:putative ABC transport system permease protein